MVIKNNTLKNHITGAVRFEERDGFLLPRRFTRKQADYIVKNDFLAPRSKMSAGVVLEFITDTNSIAFDAIFLETSRNYYSFTVYIDDILEHNFSEENVESGRQVHIEFELENGMKKVQIYFPNLFETGIKDFIIDDYSVMNKIEKGKSILFLGDSITHGYATKFTSLTYANILSRQLNANALNQAIAGDVFNDMNLDENLLFNPDMIFVAYGTNDWWHGIDITKTAQCYFDKLTKIYRQKDIYVILPIYRLDCEEKQERATMPFCEFRNILKNLCKQYENITIIDGWDFVPHFPEFYEDGYLHPNDMGFILYSENLKTKLSEVGKCLQN